MNRRASAHGDSFVRKDFKRNNSGSGFYKRSESFENSNSECEYGDLPMAFASTRRPERMTRQDYQDLEYKVHEYFNKKYLFNPPLNNWTLPEPNVMFTDEKWKIEQLQILKGELNAVKNKLNDYNLNDWHKHTRAMNKAGEIQWKLRNQFDPEFVTQAWCKFYENARSFSLVPPFVVTTNTLNSVHLCEAPGAFITSLNHFLKLHYKDVKWKWMATTLNPYYEGNPLSCMINDDRFILQTLDNWKFGKDFTGDLMNLDNMEDLVKESEKMGDVLLVTADGSIDCQEDPGEQETIVSSLHYCETVSALNLLAKGGSFLLKMFTMYEQETVCLMYLLCCAFKKVNVCKPATSKEGNSEVYVVCLEYQGKDVLKPWLTILHKHFGPNTPSKAMFPINSIPKDFLDQLYSCAELFKSLQTEVIESNIAAYHRGRSQRVNIKKLRLMISDHFMEYYEMAQLEEKDEVVGKKKLKETVTLNLDPRTEDGSFNDRREKKTLEPQERIQVLHEEMNSMKIEWPWNEDDIKWLVFPQSVSGFSIQTGKPVKTVHSSKFCLGRLLRIHNEVCELAKELSLSPASAKRCSPVTQKDNPLVAMLKAKYRSLTTDLKVLKFNPVLWSSKEAGNNEETERDAFCDIKDTMDDMWRDSNLLLLGYSMLTQFNVGIVYMLSHMFKRVGFIRPHKQDFGILFVGYGSWNKKMSSFLQEVDDKLNDLLEDGGHETVLAVLPVNQLCGKRPDVQETRPSSKTGSESDCTDTSDDWEQGDSGSVFYTCVTEVNHLFVKEQTSVIIAATINNI